MSNGPRTPSKGDDSLDSFLAGQAAPTTTDDPSLQQFHQYAKANPPKRTYTTEIGIGVVVLLIAVRVVIKLMAQN